MGRYREYHAHFKGTSFLIILVYHRLQVVCFIGVNGLTVCIFRNIFLHLLPDFIRYGNTVTVQIHAKGSNNMRLGTKTNSRTQRLASQHMRAI